MMNEGGRQISAAPLFLFFKIMKKRNKNAQWSFKDHPLIYFAWYDMVKRTTNPNFQANHPTYKGTWVSEEWKYFSNFLNWSLANGYRKGLCLDKDILDIGNKCYSPDTCVFVSNAVNSLLIYKQSSNSGLPIGVTYNECNGKAHKLKKPYRVQFLINGKPKSFGYYATPEEAGLVYSREKSKHIIHKAETLSEKDCAKYHIDIVKRALYRHANDLRQETEAKYAKFGAFYI
jgi:hypothetical protein